MKFCKIIATTALSFCLISGLSNITYAQNSPSPHYPLPSRGQFEYHEEELAGFIHFGVNTFTGSEWGSGNENPSVFNPTNLDVEQWVKEFKDAGFKRIIITGKHHDGFCLWQSKYTNHDMQGSPYKDGKGDILQELSQACTKYDIDMGFYLSPWDAHEPSYGYGNGYNDETDTNGDYNQFYMNQLREILGKETFVDEDGQTKYKYGNNGVFKEVWMDGAKGSGAAAQNYKFNEWFALIKQLQPEAVIFSPYATEIRWVGNESGIAGDPCWSKIDAQRIKDDYDIRKQEFPSYLNSGDPNGDIWSIGEADVSLRPGWFYHSSQNPKTIEQLNNIYFKSVGRGQPLLLNVPPNKEGKLSDEDVARLRQFGNAIKQTFANDLTQQSGVSITASSTRGSEYSAEKTIDNNNDTYWTMEDGQTTGSIIVDLGASKTFDVISIQEYIKLGQRVSGFKVEYKDKSGNWVTYGSGKTIGYKRLVQGTVVSAREIKITIESSQAVPLISSIGVYKASVDFELPSAVPQGLGVITANQMEASSWNYEDSDFGPGTSMWANSGTATFKFNGTKFWLGTTIDFSHGNYKVTIDGVDYGPINTNGTPRKTNAITFESPNLPNGEHTVTVTCLADKPSNNAIGINAAYFMGEGVSMFDIESKPHKVLEGDSIDVVVKRSGDLTKPASVLFTTPPDSAVQGQYYVDISKRINFLPGETEKVVKVQTLKEDRNASPTLTFYAALSDATDGSIVGFNKRTVITIENSDTITQPPAQTVYTEANPFMLPAKLGIEKRLEAEDIQLITGGNSETDVKVVNVSAASKSKMVDNFNSGNSIKLYYNAPVAGTYSIKMNFRTNASNKTVSIVGENIKDINNKTFNNTSMAIQTSAFDIVVEKEGKGIIEFIAGSNGAPGIDKLDISYKASSMAYQMPISNVFSASDRFVFPSELGALKRIEGEYMELDSSESAAGKEIRLANDTQRSNGKFVDWFTANNKLHLYYNAPAAGKYLVTINLFSGSTNSYIVSGEKLAKTTTFEISPTNAWVERSFELEISQAGEGMITLAAGSGGAPNTDYLDIALMEYSEKSSAPIVSKNLDREVYVINNQPVVLSVSASSSQGQLSYQWFKGSQELVGETNNSLTVSESGNYYVVITNIEDGKSPATVKSVSCAAIERFEVPNEKEFDINSDGTVDVKDIILSLQFAKDYKVPTAEQVAIVDINKNGIIEISEVQYILDSIVAEQLGI